MKKTLGYGLFIWILMFVIISAFVAFDYKDAAWLRFLWMVLGGVIAFVLAGKVAPTSFGGAFYYGLIWAVIGVVLDYLISRRYEPAIFSAWTYWAGYVLVLLAPVLRVKKTLPM
ncbi:MAG: hypothetical protein AAB871_00565 [Patescibacteria group bacterium]